MLFNNAMCDNCGEPANHWFGCTSVRICNDPQCGARFQAEWDAAFSEAQEEEKYTYGYNEE